MIKIEDLYKIIDANVEAKNLSIEEINLDEIENRILAKDLSALQSLPLFDNSAMDGYAIHVSDVENNTPVALPCVDRIVAGDTWNLTLAPGTCMRILTGAPLPQGATAVVPQELVSIDSSKDNIIEFLEKPNQGDHIRFKGSDVEQGSIVLKKGILLNVRHIPILISLGYKTIPVYEKLNIAIISSGTELKEAGESLKFGQIYNSNNITIKMLLNKIVPANISSFHLDDDYTKTKELIEQLDRTHDVIISSGGVSVGDEDYLGRVLSEVGSLLVNKIAFKPGKPFTLSKLPNSYAVGLPGNPYSVFVTTIFFLRAILFKYFTGKLSTIEDKFVEVESNFEHEGSVRIEVLKVQYKKNKLEKLKEQGSGHMLDISNADGLAIIPIQTRIQKGDKINYLPLDGFA